MCVIPQPQPKPPGVPAAATPHTVPTVQCRGPEWPSTEEGDQGCPRREALPPSSACCLTPGCSASLSEGPAAPESLARGRLTPSLLLFSSQPFLFPSFAPTRERQRAGGLQTRTPPQTCAVRSAGASLAGTPRQLPSLSAVPWLSTASYGGRLDFLFFPWWVFLGVLFLVFFFQRSLVKPILPKGAPLELRAIRGPLTTAVKQWCCLGSTLVLHASLHALCPAERGRCGRGHAPGAGTAAGPRLPPKAEAARVPFLPKASTWLGEPLPTFTSDQGLRKKGKRDAHGPGLGRPRSWELHVTRLNHPITCLNVLAREATFLIPE